MSVLGGHWSGTIAGSRVGTFELELEDRQGKLEGILRLLDNSSELPTQYDCAGAVEENRIDLSIAPRVFPQDMQLLPGRAKGNILPDGSIAGEWQTEDGGEGTFVGVKHTGLVPQAVLSGGGAGSTMAMRYERGNRLSSCAVDVDILRRIYRDLNAGSDEAARLELGRTPHSPEVTGAMPPVTVSEPARMRYLYSVTILATGADGEQILSLDPSLLDEGKLPTPLQSIKFAIGDLYEHLQRMPAPNRAVITLDFSRPALFDLSNVSNSPTPNGSTIMVGGYESMWVSGVYGKITTTLRQCRVKTGWLHSRYTYDILLFLIGLPACFSVATLLARNFVIDIAATIGIFLFAALASLLFFRVAFGAVRWLLPYAEFSHPPQPMHRQVRIAGSVLILGVVGSLAAAAIWGSVFRAR